MGDFCRICGDRFGLWIGPDMSDGLCPLTQARGLCVEAKARAYASGMRRKVCPEAYDDLGAIKPGMLFTMIDAMHLRGLDPGTGLPLKQRAAP